MKPIKLNKDGTIKVKEGDVQRQVLQYLAVRPDVPLSGRVNTMGVYDAKIECHRKSHYTLLGPCDVVAFIERGRFVIMVGIETKSKGKDLSPKQREYKRWFELAGNMYVKAESLKDVQNIFKVKKNSIFKK